MRPPLTRPEKARQLHAAVLAASLGAIITITRENEAAAESAASDVAVQVAGTELVERSDRAERTWWFHSGGSLYIHAPRQLPTYCRCTPLT